MTSHAVDRREFLLGATAVGAMIAFLPEAVLAQGSTQPWEEALKKVVGDAKPIEGKIMLELPEIAESGNTVPFTVSVDSPMTDGDHVKSIHIISTANPQPGVASFRLSPLNGKASVASRMRLARTQDVIAVAALSDGKFLLGRRNVKVTIGGCGG